MKRTPPPGPDTSRQPSVSARTGSNAAGRDILNSVALHVAHATLAPPEAYGPIPDDAVGDGLSNVPRGTLFVGRSAALDSLDTAFAEPGGVVLRAVSGLGGVGKSALAARWATERSTDRLRWWIGADSAAAVETGLAALARALQPGLAGLPQELQRERALAWLASHEGWLLVLDNVNHPDDVRPLLDRLGTGGRVLITTRLASGWHQLATTVRLGVFDPSESVELFHRVLTQDGPRTTEGAAEVCEELGHLALAVEQAAAYCHENGTTPLAYLAMLRSWPAETYATGAESTDADRTVARVWRITLDRLADTPLAGDVLRTLAWYAPDHIPRVLLDDLAPPPVLARAIGRLAAHSMVSVGPDGTLSVHRLVQALARTPDPDDPHRAADAVAEARERATDGLLEAAPDRPGPGKLPLGRPFLAHAEALAGNSPPEDDTEAMAHLLAWTASHLLEQDSLSPAGVLFRRALRAKVAAKGEDHQDVWTIRSNLASIRMDQGDPEGAAGLLDDVLAGMRRTLGEDHPNVLTARINLASVAYRTGDTNRAESLFDHALAEALRVGGAEHPRTLDIRSRLAHVHGARGDFRQALVLQKEVLADRVRILGDDHLDTLSSCDALASTHERSGNPTLAVPLLRRSLDGHLRLLGEDHPMTLRTRSRLAEIYRAVGNPARALGLHRTNLADAERHLGRGHSATLQFRHELARICEQMKRYDESVALYEDDVAERTRMCGLDDPEVLRARHFLAAALAEAGEHERAHTLYTGVLADMARVLGREHRDTLVARFGVAQNLLVSGKPEVALRLHERLAADRARVLGQDHPDTLSSRTQVAMALILLMRPAEGIDQLERTLADCVRALGTDAPQTVRLREDLARSFETVSGALGRSGERSSRRPGPSRGTFR